VRDRPDLSYTLAGFLGRAGSVNVLVTDLPVIC
jgi:hypothetical protein